MSLTVWLTFVVAAVLISVSPGAGAVNTMSNGLQYGVRRSVPSILGLQLGYGAQILLVGAGLGAIIASSTLALSVIKWLGVAYLIWLGIQKWREPVVTHSEGPPAETSNQKRFWQSAFVNLTNPKATVFLVALFPQFLVAGEPHGPQLATMGITLVLVDCMVMLGYALLASQLYRFMTTPRRQKRMNQVFGSLFVVAAVALASFRRT
ncbi:homoserine/homoserine lactone efflux protein [Marinobacter segnicrescens]|uniref:Homoserine/homoserine lactone efflux protein n=1 Tax=Marinobacter segnicrescens TaxID=430453 RepID=A0A1I0HFY4_9GAMM|nr:homoserine/homoserine lactone efflux protein [Marinobacter segnicrescens]SET82704.1 homoserine/homoserine lactone efflux protein [Marinobacter segnicrescens]